MKYCRGFKHGPSGTPLRELNLKSSQLIRTACGYQKRDWVPRYHIIWMCRVLDGDPLNKIYNSIDYDILWFYNKHVVYFYL